MDKLAFVIWMIGFPLGCSIERYINSHTYKLRGFSPPSESTTAVASLIEFGIWVWVAVLLWGAS